jgi:hypothetical protein
MQCPACGSPLASNVGGWCGRCGWKRPASQTGRNLLIAAAALVGVVLTIVLLFAVTASSREASRRAAIERREASEQAARSKREQDAAEKKKADDAKHEREWLRKQDEDAKRYDRHHPQPGTTAEPPPYSAICPIAAQRAIKRMGTCGLNTEGFTPESLCQKFDYAEVSFLASRSCPEMRTILSGS